MRDRSRENFEVLPPLEEVLRLRFGEGQAEQLLILADLTGSHNMPPLEQESSWELVLSSNETRFGGNDGPAFAQPEVRVLRLTTAG